jgi:hypothetical protein
MPTKPKLTLKQHIDGILNCVPSGIRVSFECRASYDAVTGDYIVGERGYSYGESILLRFSITKKKEIDNAARHPQKD